MNTDSAPFKSVFERLWLAWMATVVFDAALFLPATLCFAIFAPRLKFPPEIAELTCYSITGVLFLTCYRKAPSLRAWLLGRRKKK